MPLLRIPGIQGITTDMERHVEALLQPINQWEVVAQARDERATIGIAIEVQHAHDGDLEIYRLSLTPLWRMHARQVDYPNELGAQYSRPLTNKVQVVVDHAQRLVAFGPMGNVVLAPEEIRGCGLMSYALGRVIRWLHQGPARDYAVQSGLLSGHDGKDSVNRVRRDRCYRSVGFVVRSDAEGWGAFSAPSVATLHEPATSRVREASAYPIATLTRRVTAWLSRAHRWRRQCQAQEQRLDQLSHQLAQTQRWLTRLVMVAGVLLILLIAALVS